MNTHVDDMSPTQTPKSQARIAKRLEITAPMGEAAPNQGRAVWGTSGSTERCHFADVLLQT
jgi:hypothetical protein